MWVYSHHQNIEIIDVFGAFILEGKIQGDVESLHSISFKMSSYFMLNYLTALEKIAKRPFRVRAARVNL